MDEKMNATVRFITEETLTKQEFAVLTGAELRKMYVARLRNEQYAAWKTAGDDPSTFPKGTLQEYIDSWVSKANIKYPFEGNYTVRLLDAPEGNPLPIIGDDVTPIIEEPVSPEHTTDCDDSCRYAEIWISQEDLDDCDGNTLSDNHTIQLFFTDCDGNSVQATGFHIAGTQYRAEVCIKQNSDIDFFRYFKNDLPITATRCTAFISDTCCGAPLPVIPVDPDA